MAMNSPGEGFGYVYIYNTDLHAAQKILQPAPFEGPYIALYTLKWK